MVINDNEFLSLLYFDKKVGEHYRRSIGIRRSLIMRFERAPEGGTKLFINDPTVDCLHVKEGYSSIADLLGAKRIAPNQVQLMRAKRIRLEENEAEKERFHEICDKYAKE